MQFTSILFTLLPVLATAQNTEAFDLCAAEFRLTCPQSTDGVQRCLLVANSPVCVIDCQSQSVCRTQCEQQGFVNGFCSTGNNPCICTNLDGGPETPAP
ncbi:hypothetical protein LX36DRAFT_581267 [Colletotrichum falcatum]|nr:hypothetical protein LX36DRAFT_581267 [Colletotrichum falcatum]